MSSGQSTPLERARTAVLGSSPEIVSGRYFDSGGATNGPLYRLDLKHLSSGSNTNFFGTERTVYWTSHVERFRYNGIAPTYDTIGKSHRAMRHRTSPSDAGMVHKLALLMVFADLVQHLACQCRRCCRVEMWKKCDTYGLHSVPRLRRRICLIGRCSQRWN